MTASELRQSFLDFFREKKHTIVPSASLMPTSPNLLFTNAGMNQFVPYFLGSDEVPYNPPRATDTQKCIRAGGKHNDLEDVGYDTYHHTFFEMLGNWSFGNYFKEEAIEWAWELVVERWGFPPERLYATVYAPGDGDPAAFDEEAYDHWKVFFEKAGLDPSVHIVNGNVKDNFWAMGETGPCGPCSELHVDLTPNGDTKGSLVNADDPRCIEIWNLVFIQFNRDEDGTYRPLPAKHVDTGMGFERACSIMQCTKGFTDFSRLASNYDTDVFTPIFDKLTEISGKKYTATVPQSREGLGEQEQVDIAFRVIADHLRTLSFSIADGILPGNTGRNYVLRRILRRAVRFGREIGFTGDKPLLPQLVDTLVEQMGDAFPELKSRREAILKTLTTEETSFNHTLDRGLAMFETEAARLRAFEESGSARFQRAASGIVPDASEKPSAEGARYSKRRLPHFEKPWATYMVTISTVERRVLSPDSKSVVMSSILHFANERFELHAACVMQDHAHLLFQPWPRNRDESENPKFWSLEELMHSIKSFSANEINRIESTVGSPVWEKESFDRLIRSDSDLEEKFLYIVENPRRDGLVEEDSEYPWMWTTGSGPWKHPDGEGGVCGEAAQDSQGARQDAEHGPLEAGAPRTMPDAESGKESGRMDGPLTFPGDAAFKLYDTFGFPIDLTQLLCDERGLKVDMAEFDRLMEEQRDRGREAHSGEVITALEIATDAVTEFTGFDSDETEAEVLEVHSEDELRFIITDKTPFYAELGGQLGDHGTLVANGNEYPVTAVQQIGKARAHGVTAGANVSPGDKVTLKLDQSRRRDIEKHHTATHIMHWALHEAVDRDVAQQGSLVAPDRLRFDFNSKALDHDQVAAVEMLANEKIASDDLVSVSEVPHEQVKDRKDIMQFFGDKYGDDVRVVQIGGGDGTLDGWSMELCGGTHVRGTGEIELFKIKSEGAIAAGIRRIEAVCGDHAREYLASLAGELTESITTVQSKLDAANAELEKADEKPVSVADLDPAHAEVLRDSGSVIEVINTAIDALRGQLDAVQKSAIEAEKQLKKAAASSSAKVADAELAALLESGGDSLVASFEGSPQLLQELLNGLKKKQFGGVAFLVVNDGDKLHLGAFVAKDRTGDFQAGKLIQELAPIVGGKGGGKPEMARGAGGDVAKLEELLEKARATLS